jgi:transcriptional regulator with XRE-family HTH domain
MKTLPQIIAALPPAERAQVTARGQELIAQEYALQSLRKARHLTQVRMAEMLHMRQDSVSKLENRSDLLLSTLRSYIQAMGGNLRLIVEFPNGIAEISSFGESEEIDVPEMDNDDQPKTKARKRAHRLAAVP